MSKRKLRLLPSQEVLRELLDYDPETGVLTWRERDRKWFKTKRSYNRWNNRFAGKKAGSKMQTGYCEIKIIGTSFLLHRVTWKLVHNEEPEQVDHINHNRADNRLTNLRVATNKINGMNQSLNKLNTSGVIGVWQKSRDGRWVAEIKIDQKKMNLGCFEYKADAIAARQAANVKYNFHENHGS